MKRLLSFLVLACTMFGAASVRPQQLRCEYRVNPQGIDATEPRLSWVLAAVNPKARGLHQSAYRVLVASSDAGLRANAGDLWDSGKTESADSIHVVYRGKALNSGSAAYWKVQVWDQDGQASDWSAAAQWSMGLLHAQDWQAKWIGRDEAGVYKDPGSVYQTLEHAQWIWDTANAQTRAAAGERYFRVEFTVPAGRKVKRAIAVVGCDNQCDVYFNGQKVAGASSATLPEDHDVSGLIRPGENVLAARAQHTRADTPAGLIGAVKIEFESGEPLVISSGTHWRAAAKVEDGWEKPGYLDTVWQAAKALGDYGMAPWKEAGYLEMRRLPARMLRKEFAVDKKVRRATVYFSGQGTSELYLNGAKVGDAVLSPGLTDYDKHVLYVTYDVTRQMAQGKNAIGMMLGNGRYYAPRSGDADRHAQFRLSEGEIATQCGIRRRQPRLGGQRRKLEADGQRTHTGQQRVRRRGVRCAHGTHRLEPRRVRRCQVGGGADGGSAGGRTGVADGGAAACHRDGETGRRETTQAGRLYLRYGAEHGGLVPAAGQRPQGYAGDAAPLLRRWRRTGRCTSRTCAAPRRRIYTR